MAKETFNSCLGIKYVLDSDGFHSVQVELDESKMNIFGIAHGGVIFTLCDAASGLAIRERVDKRCVTIDSSMQFLRPAKGGTLSARGNVIKLGHTLAVIDVDVFDDEHRHIAHAVFQFFLSDE